MPVIYLGKIFHGALGLAECESIIIEKFAEQIDTGTGIQAADIADGNRVTAGIQSQRGFLNDNTLHSSIGDIHYSSYIPESYDGGDTRRRDQSTFSSVISDCPAADKKRKILS